MSKWTRPFTEIDLERIVATTFVADVEYHHVLPSTSDRALELARSQSVLLPTVVLTDEQTTGRGRGTNRWWSSEGSLTFSILIDASALQLSPDLWPRTSLTAGLAVCDAIDETLGGPYTGLKWPNDVLSGSRKVCGILVEAPPQRKDRLVLGIGVNVNNRFHGAPAELEATVTTLREIVGRRISRSELLVVILENLAAKLRSIVEQPEELRRQWQQRCILTGRTVQLELMDRCLTGVCHGIDVDGALLLETETGLERCLSGTITRWQ